MTKKTPQTSSACKEERFEELIKELKKYGIEITNRDRLSSLSNKKFAAEIREKFIENPLREYIDLEKWLKSPDPALIYQGEEATYLLKGHLVPCRVISFSKQMGNEYADIIDLQNKRVLNVPKGKLTMPGSHR